MKALNGARAGEAPLRPHKRRGGLQPGMVPA